MRWKIIEKVFGDGRTIYCLMRGDDLEITDFKHTRDHLISEWPTKELCISHMESLEAEEANNKIVSSKEVT
jgi:hypothetical protein